MSDARGTAARFRLEEAFPSLATELHNGRLDVVDEHVASLEVLFRDEVRARLLELLP